jgi:dTDP-4-amino-4,6-dideoxygalactose transaminase
LTIVTEYDGSVSAESDVILFSQPFRSPGEIENTLAVLESGHVHGDGPFTASAGRRVEEVSGAAKALLTTSGTHALDMAARLLDLGPGDEVILPSFTFSSGATSIVSAGATPVFVDNLMASGNIDPAEVEKALTPRTRAISVMHYGGVPVDMNAILSLSREFDLPIIEDNAHGLGVVAKEGSLGSLGHLAIQSFHDTKNVHCGEGGALLINDERFSERAEIMREKGTNRSLFLRGQVDKYTWVDQGSSYLPSELNAAVLDAQLRAFEEIQAARMGIWTEYRTGLAGWAERSGVTLMTPPDGVHAAHVFWMLMPTATSQQDFLSYMRGQGIIATFHYVPLHSSPAGKKFGRTVGKMPNTNTFASRLVRLPLWAGMSASQIARVIDAVVSYTP